MLMNLVQPFFSAVNCSVANWSVCMVVSENDAGFDARGRWTLLQAHMELAPM